MTITEARVDLVQTLKQIYDTNEANNIAELVLEHITQLSKTEQSINRNLLISSNQKEQGLTITKRLLQHEPIQYILEEAWFYKLKFYVDKSVLIPRPETEELVDWIVKENKNVQTPSILDIGTGSGCIPILLKKTFQSSTITALDVCANALSVAKKNATAHQTIINFILLDILIEENWKSFNQFDIIVSNPPYIPKSDSKMMNKNVLLFEPEKALFVSDEDPLIFYKTIAKFGNTHLTEKGNIYVELQAALADEVALVFKTNGYESIIIKKDMQGKNRMLRACKSIIK